MMRNMIIFLVVLVVIGLASPTGASAHGGGGGHGGGGFHAGGGGFHGGGFGGEFRERGFSFFGLYGYGNYPYYYYGGDYEDGCYLVARRVLTRYGWRRRRVEVCN
jgi:hypothetical protein